MAKIETGNQEGPLTYLKFTAQFVYLLLYTLFYFIQFIYFSIVGRQRRALKRTDIILVTGGSNGIGREICLGLGKLENGVTIISWDVNQEANDLLVKELKSLGINNSFAFKVDVSNKAEVEAAAAQLRQDIGHVTILINNAGVLGEIGIGWEMTPQVVQKVFDINLVSHCWTLKEFLPAMIQKGEGHVVETCSVAGFLSGGFISPYIASKQGLRGYIECLKEDVRKLPNKPKINFTLVYPSVTQTNMVALVDYKVAHDTLVVPYMSPRYVARQVIDGILTNEEHVYVPGWMRYMSMIVPLMPPPAYRKCIDMMDMDLAPAAPKK